MKYHCTERNGFEQDMNNSLLYFDLSNLCEMISDFLIYDIQSKVPRNGNCIYSSSSELEIPSHPTRFHSKRLPEIPLGCYLKRIAKSIPSFNSLILLLMIVYYKRLRELRRDFKFDLLMIHRFVAAIVCVGCKFTSDFFFSNTYYGKICGVTAVEMNVLELEFLLLMDWRILYSIEDVEEAIHSLKSIDCNV